MTDRISTDELRKLLELSTPGPWAYEAHGDTQAYGIGVCYEVSDIELAFPLSGQVTSDVMVIDPVCPEVSGQCNARLIALSPDLAAEVIRLREALEPFAKVAEHDIGCDEADTDVFRPMKLFNHAPLIRVGDLRIARAALNHKETDNG